MKPRVIIRAQARRDLLVNYVFLAESADLKTAQNFRLAVDTACGLLAEMPLIGAPRQLKKSASLMREFGLLRGSEIF